MISNEKILNHKVIDLDESYKFHINLYLHPSSYDKVKILEYGLTPTVV
jgi:hypothetical protein